jgi:transmembrane sensor
MSKDLARQRQTAEASEWLIRLREQPDDESTLASWLRWCESDSSNAQAFERVQSLWRQLDTIFASNSAIDQALRDATRSDPIESGKWRRVAARSPWKTAGALALAVGCATIVFIAWHRDLHVTPPPAIAVAKQNRAALLPDGSAIELGAQTTVAVDFSPGKRALRLSPGEAYFKVKPDKTRPFTVRAGNIEVTAVGTAFDVKHQPQSVTVTVQEGVVEVNALSGAVAQPASIPWRVAGGYQFTYSDSEGTATLSSVDTSSVLAWREGRWEYTHTPLSDVLADVNRYARHPIVIADPSLESLTFTGTVFAASIDNWVSALPGALPLTVQRTTDGRILLHANTAAGSPNK